MGKTISYTYSIEALKEVLLSDIGKDIPFNTDDIEISIDQLYDNPPDGITITWKV